MFTIANSCPYVIAGMILKIALIKNAGIHMNIRMSSSKDTGWCVTSNVMIIRYAKKATTAIVMEISISVILFTSTPVSTNCLEKK